MTFNITFAYIKPSINQRYQCHEEVEDILASMITANKGTAAIELHT